VSHLLVYIEAEHFHFHAHRLADASLASGPVAILRGDDFLDCSPDVTPGRSLSYVRTAYRGLREVIFDPAACDGLSEILWGQVLPFAGAIEPVADGQGFYEPARDMPEDMRRDLADLRERIGEATGGLAVRAGAGPSRLMARVAAQAGRVVAAEETPSFLARAPLDWLPFAGRAIQRLRDLGLERIGEAATAGQGVLYHCLGREDAAALIAALAGRGDRYVKALYPPERIEEHVNPGEEPDEPRLQALMLAAGRRLLLRLELQRRWPRQIALTLEPMHGLARRADAPLVRPPAGAEELARRYLRLFHDLWRGEGLAAATLEARDFEALSPAQQGLHSSAGAAQEREVSRVLEALRERFGKDAIGPAANRPSARRWAEHVLACGAA
jgi:hypothetical protein